MKNLLADADAAYRRGDFANALRISRPLASLEYAAAQNNLGFMYANGQGVAQDYAEALKWYRLAAAQDARRRARLLELAHARGRLGGPGQGPRRRVGACARRLLARVLLQHQDGRLDVDAAVCLSARGDYYT